MKKNKIDALLEEAKKRYPKGTAFIPTMRDPSSMDFSICSGEFRVDSEYIIDMVTQFSIYNGYNKLWARKRTEIKEQPEYKILSYIGKLSGAIWKLNEEREQYFHNNIYLRDTKSNALNIHSVMNKDGNTFDIDDEITLIEGVNKGNKFIITGFRMKKNGSTVCAITETHTPYGVGINKIEHYIEKEPEFILPEKWCIKTEKLSENSQIIGNWFNFQSGNYCYTFSCLGMFYHSDNYSRQNILTKGSLAASFADNPKRNTYTEITFEQFKKYVLKEEELSPIQLANIQHPELANVEKPLIIAKGLADQVKLAQQGIKSIVIPHETLLEKAKRLYPVGTKFLSASRNTCRCTVEHEPILRDNGNISTMDNGRNGIVYYEGQWAEIIEEVEPKVGDKF